MRRVSLILICILVAFGCGYAACYFFSRAMSDRAPLPSGPVTVVSGPEDLTLDYADKWIKSGQSPWRILGYRRYSQIGRSDVGFAKICENLQSDDRNKVLAATHAVAINGADFGYIPPLRTAAMRYANDENVNRACMNAIASLFGYLLELPGGTDEWLKKNRKLWDGVDYEDYWGAKVCQAVRLLRAKINPNDKEAAKKDFESIEYLGHSSMDLMVSRKSQKVVCKLMDALAACDDDSRVVVLEFILDGLQDRLGNMNLPVSRDDQAGWDRVRRETLDWWSQQKGLSLSDWLMYYAGKSGMPTDMSNPAAILQWLAGEMQTGDELHKQSAYIVFAGLFPPIDDMPLPGGLCCKRDDEKEESTYFKYLIAKQLVGVWYWVDYSRALWWDEKEKRYRCDPTTGTLPASRPVDQPNGST